LVVRKTVAVVPGCSLSVWRKGVDGLVRGHGCIVIPTDHTCTVLSHEGYALGRVCVVPDNVAQTVDGVDLCPFKELKGTREGLQVRVNIRENCESHGSMSRNCERRTAKNTIYVGFSTHRIRG
jgi:hypothetical protein